LIRRGVQVLALFGHPAGWLDPDSLTFDR